ncbi:adenosine deaminase-like [Clytia hemisphaerica]|uniref:adenosine deaminase n=1 Tax=Clytia hemisphaerica TaxID=252671 RepID=A0A7M5WS43_9CNID
MCKIMKKTQIAGGSKQKQNSNWKVFDFCNQFLQTREDLSSMTYQLVNNLFNDHGVNYIEIRFAPVLHTLKNLTELEAVRAVVEGFKNAVKHFKDNQNVEIKGGIILCILRSYPPKKAFETLDLYSQSNDVLAIDVAGDEGSYPLELFKDVLVEARRRQIPITVHAGEWNEHTNATIIDNVNLAADIGVQRIGHGLALRSCDESIYEEYRLKDISIEVCLTSNCGNKTKCESFAKHPIKKFIRKGLKVSALNVDNLLLSGSLDIGAPDPTNECVRAILDCGLSSRDLLEIIENGYKAGFATIDQSFIENALNKWRTIYLPKIEDLLSKYDIVSQALQ